MLDDSVLKTGKLFVVGNVNRDIKTTPFSSGDRLFSDGETSIHGIVETIGGGGANSAAAAANLGAMIAFAGQVGSDALADKLEHAMTNCDVSCFLNRNSNYVTGTTINLVYESGSRHFISSLPNNDNLTFDNLDLTHLAQYDHLFRADIWFSESMLYGGNEQLFKHAKQVGLDISIDLNWDPKCGTASPEKIKRRKDAIRALLPMVDLAHGNIRELNEFADSNDLQETLKKLERWGLGAVVLHMGSKGAGYYSDGKLVVETPVTASRQINATGTGDILSVCMMLMYHHEDAISEKLHLANTIVAQFIEGNRQLIPRLDAQ